MKTSRRLRYFITRIGKSLAIKQATTNNIKTKYDECVGIIAIHFIVVITISVVWAISYFSLSDLIKKNELVAWWFSSARIGLSLVAICRAALLCLKAAFGNPLAKRTFM